MAVYGMFVFGIMSLAPKKFDHKPVKVALLTDHDWYSESLNGSEYDELVSLHHNFSCELMRYISQEMERTETQSCFSIHKFCL